MAGVRFRAVTAQITTGTSAKTLLQIVAASNHRTLVDEVHIAFEGTTSTDAPIQVRILKQTTAGTMSALTLVKKCAADDETLQTTALHTASAEPTAGDVYFSTLVHPQGGRLSLVLPRDKAFQIVGGQRLGIEVTAGAAVDAVVTVEGEE